MTEHSPGHLADSASSQHLREFFFLNTMDPRTSLTLSGVVTKVLKTSL